MSSNFSNTSVSVRALRESSLFIPWYIFLCLFASSTAFALVVLLTESRVRCRIQGRQLKDGKEEKGQVLARQGEGASSDKLRRHSPAKGGGQVAKTVQHIDLALEKIKPEPFSLSSASVRSISI